ncbi:MAG TPA: alpha/beta hydrolase [Albitalea sp.]|uniref:RBBP9/YdeN family alpha/beta hydrolase n=1 Tax=Piscinibacter sp. TaxID=1903157 RepID=UPI002ECFC7E7
MRRSDTPRLLIVPGLHDSGPAHWQSWLQGLHRDACRVRQRDWSDPDLDRWSARIDTTLAHAGEGPFVAAAHSFGCLALAHHLAQRPDSPIVAALLVAPADPARFGIAERLGARRLERSTTVVTSDTDPWMRAAEARRWAARWGSHVVNLGDAGHINVESGFGPLPLAARWVDGMRQRYARSRRPRHASFGEWSFAT